MFQRTTAINKILALTKRKKIIQGGTSAGKTYGILPILIDKALKTPRLEISVVSESIPHLRRGAMKDCLKILQDTERFTDSFWNRSLLTYTFHNGSYIEFFSADQEGRLRGARRNILYINEANNIPFDAYHQLAIRTSKDIYLDFNPTSQFWAHNEVLPESDAELIVLSYKDNEALPNTIKEDIEAAQFKEGAYWQNWWKVYGLGEVGSLQGVVFENWTQVDTMPTGRKWTVYGIDFGFSSDPTAIVEVAMSDGEIYLNEHTYSTGLTSSDISERVHAVKRNEMIADSADPKTIEELRRRGCNVRPCVKGPDSIRSGIDLMQTLKLHVTKRSTNIIKEFRGYVWAKDRAGDTTKKPIDNFNHAMDAIRYVISGKVNSTGHYNIR